MSCPQKKNPQFVKKMCFIRIPFVDSRVGYPYFQMFLDLSSFISSYLALRIECGFSLRLNGGMMTAVNDFTLKSSRVVQTKPHSGRMKSIRTE